MLVIVVMMVTVLVMTMTMAMLMKACERMLRVGRGGRGMGCARVEGRRGRKGR